MIYINNLTQIQKRILIIGIILVVGIITFYVYTKDNNYEEVREDEIMIKNEVESEESKENKIVVHIMGAVKNEGIVELNEGSRVSDAVNSAGGLTEEADMSKINLAYVLEDGVKIRIPSINDNVEEEYITTDGSEIVENTNQETESSGKTSLININKASQSELDTLPGIGPSIALKIISYREENGDFASIEDIKNVNGIGDSKFEEIKDLICI